MKYDRNLMQRVENEKISANSRFIQIINLRPLSKSQCVRL